ncbi:hypothetical protein EDM53_01880 [Rickettsiales endosymbiont of Peranema trichophorum]|uniref:hypothetical protein n=1 Tax=Rickettsiales endosymbiont of Peranema trichophorum TaxID=2486577 RepID=UPI001023593E|nr:hypothetical protein [Rickettsiales endosymbiont of Peranema trichophorum]RZI47443.1 hypothetical protein EDM53_01880 [Rickettsiales endosymbiont of Peranema trichophorum]
MKLLVIMILILLPLSEVMSEEGGVVKKKYPPYPDIWGYNFSENHGGSGIYLAPDGEVVVSFSKCSCKGCCEGKEKQWIGELVYYVRKFFEGTDIKIGDAIARDQFIKDNGLKDTWKIPDNEITLRNGITVLASCSGTGRLCRHNEMRQCTLIKGRKQPGDDRVYKYHEGVESFYVVVLQDDISTEVSETEDYCECRALGTTFYNQLSFFPNRLVPLDDNTFLAGGSNGSGSTAIVRFDQNMNSKFQLSGSVELAPGEIIEGRIFAIPSSAIDGDYAELCVKEYDGIQGLHDLLLLYLYEEYGRKK